VEFVSETYSHSLASLVNNDIFQQQVKLHEQKIVDLFGQKPKVFRNTEMIYSDEIGEQVYKMGYKAMLTEGARQVLGWKSPNFLYVNAINPRIKILMRNFKLSDDIAFRFSNSNWSEFPLTAEKFTSWIEKLDPREEIINLFLSYETFGQRQPNTSGIFDFLEHWIGNVVKNDKLRFISPSQVVQEVQPISIVSVPDPISWADEERDLTLWLGNEMQKEAITKLYVHSQQMTHCQNMELIKDWNYLQESDHFYTMSTKFFSGSHKQIFVNPYNSPYEAFINYMNILSDFTMRLNDETPCLNDEHKNSEKLKEIIREKDKKIKILEFELETLKKSKSKSKSTIKKYNRK
jgi:alpha-amylase